MNITKQTYLKTKMFNRFFFLFIIILNFNISSLVTAENKILFKVNDKIITTIDISNEINYLILVNPKIRELEQSEILEIAKNNLIKDKIKEIELLKNFEKIKINDEQLELLVKNTYNNIGLNSIDQFKEHLKNNNINLKMIKEKITLNIFWKQFIYSKYKNQIIIDKEKIAKDIKNKKTRIYDLSEILFFLNSDESFSEKYNIIKSSIEKNGFENTALVHSKADSYETGGKIGWINETAISNKILLELNSTKINSHTNPISVQGGFLILKINDYKDEKKQSDAEKEIARVINIKTNEQINQFSNLFINRLKKNIIINET